MSLPCYPQYKDSGVQWLGVVPEHWKVEKLKNVLHIKKEVVGKNSADYTLLSLTLQGIIPRDLDNPQGKFPAEFDTYQAVEKNDLIFCLFDVEETPRAVGISDFTGMITGAYTVCHVEKSNNPKFVYYFYLSRDQYKAFKMYYSGLRNVIRKEVFLSIPFPYPSLDEQTAIAAFLDRETGKIDALIAEQEKLLTLLAEKRQATISHAVTKGLNPDVPMKDSGVEWLGKVPEHWMSCRLRRYATFIDGDRGIEYPNEKDFTNDGIVFLSSKNIVSNQLDLTEVKYISEEKFNALNRGKALDGDLIVKVRGSAGRIGELAKFDAKKIGIETAFINAQMMILRVRENILPDFLCLISQGIYWTEQLYVGAYGTAQQQLSNEVFANLFIAVPPLTEQELIVNFTKSTISKFDSLIDATRGSINLMKERRSALIAAAVTGKIDVRDLAAEEVAA